MKKFVVILLLLVFPFSTLHADELKLAESAKSAIMLETSTGEILFEKNSHERLVPASMTKMMDTIL